ncbi:hypothetical protein BCR44DRAFT_1256869 [Catenaria anguillulae PL171]|uniref:Uncharacterized protein n=1 Tax=Catenaria anguillulae PL171 TaxID=765915 RepID=A0A1Y2HFP9_9FUNG|nr:hypothetical protein BCR44DRAFT_1256869 [Catenaria anguillulae PL171]
MKGCCGCRRGRSGVCEVRRLSTAQARRCCQKMIRKVKHSTRSLACKSAQTIAKQRPCWRRTKADVCVPVTFIPPAPAEPDTPPVVLMLSPGPSLLPSAPTPLPGAAPDVSDEDEEDVDSRSRPDTLMPREGNAEGASVGQSAVGLGLGAAAEGRGGECVGAVSMAGIENGKPDVFKDSGVVAEADCRPCQVLG